MELINLLQVIGGILAGFGGGWAILTRNGRREAEAKADKAVAETYEYRLSLANERVIQAGETEKSHLERISQLNRALDAKTDQIRNLTQKLWESEQETNRVNRELVAAQEEIGKLKLHKEHYREWRCYRADCMDTRGRKPKQEKEHTEDGKDI